MPSSAAARGRLPAPRPIAGADRRCGRRVAASAAADAARDSNDPDTLPSAALALALAALPAAADEFTDTLESALEAYRDGDIAGARADLDYAGKLLTAMKSEALAKFLPAAQPGWTREAAAGTRPARRAGSWRCWAAAPRRRPPTARERRASTITLVADSPMVSGLGAMISGMAGLAGGKPLRIQRTEFTTNDGELQGVVNDRVMVSVSGDAASRTRPRISRRWTSRRWALRRDPLGCRTLASPIDPAESSATPPRHAAEDREPGRGGEDEEAVASSTALAAWAWPRA